MISGNREAVNRGAHSRPSGVKVPGMVEAGQMPLELEPWEDL